MEITAKTINVMYCSLEAFAPWRVVIHVPGILPRVEMTRKTPTCKGTGSEDKNWQVNPNDNAASNGG